MIHFNLVDEEPVTYSKHFGNHSRTWRVCARGHRFIEFNTVNAVAISSLIISSLVLLHTNVAEVSLLYLSESPCLFIYLMAVPYQGC